MRRFKDVRMPLQSAAVALALAGCGAPMIMQSSNDAAIRPGILGTFQYAAGGRDMLTVIAGNPFPVPDGVLAGAVTAAMQNSHNGPATTFVTLPTATTIPGFHILVRLDGPRTIPNDRDCGKTPPPPPPAAGSADLNLTMVFCGSETAMSWVVASTPRPFGPDDPAFVGLIRNSMRNLIPSRDDEPGNGDQAGDGGGIRRLSLGAAAVPG